jgi:hypothetical protein
MQHSLSEGHYSRGDHRPDADYAGSASGGATPPIGQLADYYPVIAQAVHRLEQNTAQTRQTIYDRARAAMAVELHSLTPPLGESVGTREGDQEGRNGESAVLASSGGVDETAAQCTGRADSRNRRRTSEAASPIDQ